MEKKMIKQMMMALLLAMMPFAASAQEFSIEGSWANEPAKLGKNKSFSMSFIKHIGMVVLALLIALPLSAQHAFRECGRGQGFSS